MRFNRRNWIKFFDGSNKKTTIRLRKSKLGQNKAHAGSYYHPEILGVFDVTEIRELHFGGLTEQNAIDDGFKDLEGLKNELVRLNGKLEPDQVLWQHWIENIIRNKS